MKKAILLILLLLLPILLLTACGGADKPAATSAITTTATSAPVTTAPITTPAVTSTPDVTVPVTIVPDTTPTQTTPTASITTAPITTAPVTTAPVTTAPITTAPITTSPDTASGNITIAGVPLEEFVIVYAKSEYATKRSSLQGTEYDFYKLTAERIAADIKELCGVTLEVVAQTKAEKAHEILVGPTNRAESKCLEGLDLYVYVNRVVNGKLVIGGGRETRPYTENIRNHYTYAATYHAFDALLDAAKAGNTAWAEGFDLSGERHFTTIACVGDSITDGATWSDADYIPWPSVMQRVLWQDYIVLNLGYSGKTMRNDIQGTQYTGSAQHTALLKWAHKIDLTLVMLGTNDSYWDRYWTAADDKLYNDAATLLLSSVRKRNPDMNLVIMNCPIYYGNLGWGSVRVRNLQAGLPELLAGKGIQDVMFFNMYEFTANNVGSANFPDQLHPNEKGYGIMGKALAGLIPDFLSGEWDAEPVFFEEPTGEAPDVAIAQGAVNLLGYELDRMYPWHSGKYYSWNMGGAPYFYANLNAFGGHTITNIEFPVLMAKKGDTLSVQVVKYQNNQVVEVLSTHTLTADFECGMSWAKFAVNIEVPQGYTLLFGKPGDTLSLLYIEAQVNGYSFYNLTGGSSAATLAFNVYGIPHTTDGE